jgi:uncharacterized protein (TIGR03437 family)
MSRRLVLLLTFLGCLGPAYGIRPGAPAAVPAPGRTLSFVPLDQPSTFLARGAYSARIEAHRMTIAARGAALEVLLEGADPAASGTALEPLPGRENRLLGNRPEFWRTGIPAFGRVRYQSVYRGIDVEYYAAGRQLECDFLVAPGANPDAIQFRFRGARSVRRDLAGGLVVNAAGRVLSIGLPRIYQQTLEGRAAILGEYVILPHGRAAIRLGAYDRSRTLVIDPVVTVSTYLGGSGDETLKSTNDPRIAGVAADSRGNAYVVGHTESADFPLAGPYQNTLKGSSDLFVSKFGPDGTLIYSTLIGGSSLERAFGIAVDSDGAAYIAGRTQSRDFPTRNAAQDSMSGGQDAVVVKLNAAGNQLVYSTYFGGSGAADTANGIAVDASGNAWVAGNTDSTNLPQAGAPYQAANKGGGDAFAARFGPAGLLLYSTYLGGAGVDHGEAVAVDSSGSAYLTGYTQSSDFPARTTIRQGASASKKAFAVKFRSDGALSYSTVLSGSTSDAGMGIAVDSTGAAYVTGITSSSDFPVTAGAFQTVFGGGASDAFIAALKPDGGALLWATYLGGDDEEEGDGIAVDRDGNVYAEGSTESGQFPILDAFQPKRSGIRDAFLTKLKAGGKTLAHSSYLGGTALDRGRGVALVSGGGVWMTGTTNSSNFPVLNASQRTLKGSGDVFLVRLEETPAVSVTSAASYWSEPVAPNSIASAWGEGFATGLKATPGLPLPATLAGAGVTIQDAEGTERTAGLFFVAPGQINFLVPDGTANGHAFVRVTRAGKTSLTGGLRIARVSPGLFSANADGRGVGAIVALHVASNGAQTSEIVYTCSASGCTATPISLGDASSRLILMLYGTGIRGFASTPSVTIGGAASQVLGAAAQSEYPGLDQVNVQVPRSLAGRGDVEIVVTVDGIAANPVRVTIR